MTRYAAADAHRLAALRTTGRSGAAPVSLHPATAQSVQRTSVPHKSPCLGDRGLVAECPGNRTTTAGGGGHLLPSRPAPQT